MIIAKIQLKRFVSGLEDTIMRIEIDPETKIKPALIKDLVSLRDEMNQIIEEDEYEVSH